jgi:bifunctional NMN adenylyltransferase/nudix hydrolase
MKKLVNIPMAQGHVNPDKKYDLLVFIGRFQPFHVGHARVVERALALSRNVLMIVGSAGKARSLRNPFTYEERQQMINAVYPNVIVRPMNDRAYNDTQWIKGVQDIVKEVAIDIVNPHNTNFRTSGWSDLKIGLIGCEKDHTSYYLKLFPQWLSENVEFASPMNATAIRQAYFSGHYHERWLADVIMPDEVFHFLEDFRVTAEYARLALEHEYIQEYEQDWGQGPFLTADSLVQVAGNILLIKRGKEYGHGLYALPGGFLNKNEKFFEGAIRELREETRLRVPVPVLKGSMVASDIFDDPHRSERGRVITRCFHFRLENELSLPEVRGSDDAEWAGWVDISSLNEADFFEDHFHIIVKMLGV